MTAQELPDRRGLLIILSSPSGAGKTTIARRLLAADPAMGFSVSATTRPPRPGEMDGREYHFVTRPEFEAMAARGDLLEYAEVFGNLYGSPRRPIEAAMSEGRDTIFDIDWQGGQQIRASALGREVVSVFILPPSMAELERRLRSRGQDSEEVITGRMARSMAEVSHWAEYDYVLVNRDLDETEARVRHIVEVERLRRERQPWLDDFVRGLAREFEGGAMIWALDGQAPEIHPTAWIAPDAQVVGRVRIGANASVWFGAVLRGDNEWIEVGEGTNIQDLSCLHSDWGFPLSIGAGCTVGHRAMLHGCTIGPNTLIGMSATVLNGASVGRDSLVGAGSLVTEGKSFEPCSLIVGSPARVLRPLDYTGVASLERSARHYAENAARFAQGLSQAVSGSDG